MNTIQTGLLMLGIFFTGVIIVIIIANKISKEAKWKKQKKQTAIQKLEQLARK